MAEDAVNIDLPRNCASAQWKAVTLFGAALLLARAVGVYFGKHWLAKPVDESALVPPLQQDAPVDGNATKSFSPSAPSGEPMLVRVNTVHVKVPQGKPRPPRLGAGYRSDIVPRTPCDSIQTITTLPAASTNSTSGV